MALTRKNAQQLLDDGYISQEQFDAMHKDGVVKVSERATRPQINVPTEHKAAFMDAAYEALEGIAKKMKFDHTIVTPDGGLATLYIKGSGSPRASDEVSGELTDDSE